MSWSLPVLIIANIFIINIRLRVSEIIFNKDLTTHHKAVIPFLWVVIAIALWQYPAIAWRLEQGSLIFSQQAVSTVSIAGLIVYGFIVLFILWLIIREKPTTKEIVWYLIFMVLIGVLVWFAPVIWLSSILLYYLIVATSEETLKYFWSSFISKWTLINSDKILRWVLIALWFSFFENIVYILPSTSLFFESFGLLVNRWAIWFLMHSIFTWITTLFVVRAYQTTREPTVLFIAGAFLAGVWLHFIYNSVIHFWNNIVLLCFITAWYFLLTYLFYHADRVYFEELLK